MSAVSTQHSLMRDHYLSSKLVIGIPFCNMTVGILPLHFRPIFIRHSLSAIPISHSPPLLAISGFSAQNFQAPSPLPVSIKPPNRQKCVKYRVYKTRVIEIIVVKSFRQVLPSLQTKSNGIYGTLFFPTLESAIHREGGQLSLD